MNIVSIPVLVIAGITFFIALIHLINYFFTKEKEYILFFFTSSVIVVYDFFCVQLYNSTSLTQGIYWQRLQIILLALMSIPLLWFVIVYTKQKKKIIPSILTISFFINFISVNFFKNKLAFSLDKPFIKTISLFNNIINVTYYEVKPGPLIQLQLLVSIAALIYTYYLFIRYFIQTRNKESLLIIIGFIIFTLGMINDSFVARNIYNFLYVIEYGYFALAVTMAITLILRQARFQQKLNESEVLYSQITSSIPGAVFQYVVKKDRSIKLLYVSDSLRNIVDSFNDNKTINEKVFLDAVHTDDIERVSKAINKSVENVYSYEEEFRILEKNGNIIWVKALSKPLKLENGDVLWNGVILDVTARKKVEEERELLINQLDVRNKELQDIIYVMSHDLKTPLVNIIGFSSELEYFIDEIESIHEEKNKNIMEEKIGEILVNNDTRESLKFIKNSTFKMDSLINGLLKFSRFGRTVFEKKKTDINNVVNDIIDTLQFSIKEKKVKITVDKLPSCISDEKLINQVVTNLLDNAIKYLNPLRKGIIKISGYTKDKYSIYCIEDNGIGISKGYIGKIFDIFYKIDTDTSTIGEGLGLSIVKSLLNYNNGRIWVESEEGIGSKFFFQLPSV